MAQERFRYFALGNPGDADGLIRFDTQRVWTATWNRENRWFWEHTQEIFEDSLKTISGEENDGFEVTRDDAVSIMASLKGYEMPIEEARRLLDESER